MFLFLYSHQKRSTANFLALHRNTVIYRLDKCEQLTGRSLRVPTTACASVQLFL
ncbi:helix-turn-helix domain-containing protein [Paenibacillus gallinarum]|uniref:Helix-turn-helix domain-containing protein n=1 Tax=Paenibacillus gallinarum TaxID=2762232 RepID=A0ABR8SYM7_9BACL|nr:helix-turn-helix domain-containing protein [Paenibacillus gallinarum]